MKDQIIVNLPYPKKIFGVQFSTARKIGFLFTNLSIFLFREANNIQDTDQYKKFIEEKGHGFLVSEMLYFAAVAYAFQNKQKENFGKEELRIAINSAPQEIQTALMNAWQQSNTFGLKDGEQLKKKPSRLKKM